MRKYKDQLTEALSRMFPSIESFNDFKVNNADLANIINLKLMDLAFSQKYIAAKTEHELINLIQDMALNRMSPPHETISFEEALDNIAQGVSINYIIQRMNRIAVDLGFPKVQASMITRLKKNGYFKTSRQQLLLRLIAFWVGIERPHLPYTYDSITELFDRVPTDVQDIEDEGVRVDFTFIQQNETIDFQMIEWLKTELQQCIKDMNFFCITGNRISFYSTTTATMKIKKDKGPALEPLLYSKAIRIALAIAHQITVRWAISPMNKKQNTMIVGIAAGKFSKLPIQIQALIDSQLNENYIVRMTDYAKLCVCITDAKVIFHKVPSTQSLKNGEVLSIWAIKHFWFLYYDFIPKLLDEDMLPTNTSAYDNFKNLIYFPGNTVISPGNNGLHAIRKFPQNDLLIIETAKVCFSRRMFAEANNILTIIFASDPYNPVARTLRMVIFLNMAMEQRDYTVFELYYDRAKKEGDFVLKYCKEEEEEIWCEYGLIFWTRAIFILKQLRKNIIPDKNQRNRFKNMLLSDLKEAEICFQNGMIFSPTVNRPGFWIVHLKSLYEMIKHDESITESTTEIKDTMGIYAIESIKFFISLGWVDPSVLALKDDNERVRQLNLFTNRMSQAIHTYAGSVHLRMYKPNVAYSIATVLWDFSPMITTGIVRSVLEWLEKSRSYARQLVITNTGIFSIVSWYSQIQDPRHFIECVTRAISKIHSIVQNNLDHDDNVLIDNNAINGFKLFPMFFDEDIQPNILY